MKNIEDCWAKTKKVDLGLKNESTEGKVMKKLLAILFFLLLPVLAVFSQETDSLLLADF
jgi:hypothetical protein